LHLERHGVPFAEDPSNRDTRFLRVRVRTELLPLLKALSPKIVEHLTALADEIERPRPAFVAPGGEPLVLGRAQHAMVEALLRDGSRSGRVPLRGGWELSVDPGTGALRLGAAARRERGAAARPRRTNPDGP
jgi:tRNA(Ile)-lysidine synthase